MCHKSSNTVREHSIAQKTNSIVHTRVLAASRTIIFHPLKWSRKHLPSKAVPALLSMDLRADYGLTGHLKHLRAHVHRNWKLYASLVFFPFFFLYQQICLFDCSSAYFLLRHTFLRNLDAPTILMPIGFINKYDQLKNVSIILQLKHYSLVKRGGFQKIVGDDRSIKWRLKVRENMRSDS